MKKIIILTSFFLIYLLFDLRSQSNEKDFANIDENSISVKILDVKKNKIKTFFIPLPTR
jgi:hypothetical protein